MYTFFIRLLRTDLWLNSQLSEAAQDARNKDIKRFREDFSRKCSREYTMHDVFNWLLVTSDPYISSIRKLPQKPLKSLSPEAIELLVPPTFHVAATDDKYTNFDSESSRTDTDSDIHCDSNMEFDFWFWNKYILSIMYVLWIIFCSLSSAASSKTLEYRISIVLKMFSIYCNALIVWNLNSHRSALR